jgi:hypothetical protein
MKTGDKVRCAYVGNRFKQITTPPLRVGWVYVIESMKIDEESDGSKLVGFSLVGMKSKTDSGRVFFTADTFEYITDATIRADARKGLFKKA